MKNLFKERPMRKALRIEWKRNFCKILMATIIIFTILAVLLLQLGIEKYKYKIGDIANFVEIEQKKVATHPAYFQYFFYGFRMLSQPHSLLSLSHNTAVFGDIIGFVDSGMALKLSKAQIGEGIYEKSMGGDMDLSWYFLIVGSILALAWGFGSFRNTELIKFMLNFTHLRSIYLGIVLARVLLIVLALALLGVIIWAQFLLNGISLGSAELTNLLVFILLTMVVMIIFLLIGSIFGTIRNKVRMGIILFFSCLMLLLVWPEILNSVFSKNAILNMKSKFVQEKQRIQIMMDLEDIYAKYSKMDPSTIQSNMDFILTSFRDAYKKIEDLEYEMIDKTKEIAGRLHFWSIFNPVTFYKSVNNELSSMGYGGYTAFYEEVIQKQKAFVDFYIQKRFYEKSQKVEPFLTGDDYIFKARGSLPRYFALGLALNLFYVLAALYLSYFSFKRFIFPKPVDALAFETLSIDLQSQNHYIFRFDDPEKDFLDQMFNVYSGQERDFRGKIAVDGESFVNRQKKDFVYLPTVKEIPGEIEIKDLLGLCALSRKDMEYLQTKIGLVEKKRLSDLDRPDKVRLLFKIAASKKPGTYLLNNFLLGIPLESMYELFKQLKKAGSTVLELRLNFMYGGHPGLKNGIAVTLFDDGYKATVFLDKKE